MATHFDLIRDTKIRYLLIPGSHDSGTYNIPPQSLLYELTCTQHVSIHSQLTSGIRYIDLRYGPGSPHPTDIHILHHSAKSITLNQALTQISNFISQNPKEIIFLKIQREKDCNLPQNLHIYNSIKKIFGAEKIVKRSESLDLNGASSEAWFSFHRSTFGDVVGKGKNYFLFLEPRMFVGTGFENEFFGRFEYIDAWMDQSCCEGLWGRLEESVRGYQDFDREFYVAQVVLTPSWSFWKGVGVVLGCGTGSVSKHMGFLLKDDRIRYFTKEMVNSYKCNTFMYDFVDWIPDLLRFILVSNFQKSLEIKYAVLGGQELDPLEVQNHVTYAKNSEGFFKELEGSGGKVGNVLYLPNFLKDMGLMDLGGKSEDRFLVVGYSWRGDPGTHFEVFDVSNEKILIGYSGRQAEAKAGQPRIFIDQFDRTSDLIERLNANPTETFEAHCVNSKNPSLCKPEVRIVKETNGRIDIQKLTLTDAIRNHL
jgi:hypothetical protein